MDVVLVRWPGEAGRLERLRGSHTPRLLLVQADTAPPALVDCLEDWVRVPAEESELRTRLDALTLRAEHHDLRMKPEMEPDGLLRFRERWVDLPPVEFALAAVLVERYGAVVGREALTRRAWPGERPTRNALDVHMSRLRRRIAPLGMAIRTIRARGYILTVLDADAHKLPSDRRVKRDIVRLHSRTGGETLGP